MKRETKDTVQMLSAIGMLVLGSGLSIADFVMLHGVIHDSILWLFAQCLIYAGSVFGVSVYVTGRLNKFKDELINHKEERK